MCRDFGGARRPGWLPVRRLQAELLGRQPCARHHLVGRRDAHHVFHLSHGSATRFGASKLWCGYLRRHHGGGRCVVCGAGLGHGHAAGCHRWLHRCGCGVFATLPVRGGVERTRGRHPGNRVRRERPHGRLHDAGADYFAGVSHLVGCRPAQHRTHLFAAVWLGCASGWGLRLRHGRAAAGSRVARCGGWHFGALNWRWWLVRFRGHRLTRWLRLSGDLPLWLGRGQPRTCCGKAHFSSNRRLCLAGPGGYVSATGPTRHAVRHGGFIWFGFSRVSERNPGGAPDRGVVVPDTVSLYGARDLVYLLGGAARGCAHRVGTVSVDGRHPAGQFVVQHRLCRGAVVSADPGHHDCLHGTPTGCCPA